MYNRIKLKQRFITIFLVRFLDLDQSDKTHQALREKKRLEPSSRAFASPGTERVPHPRLEPQHSPFSKASSSQYRFQLIAMK